MTLQWTAVATFLYVEIGVLVILCLPFISAKRWSSVFHLRIWGNLARFWNKAFLTMIIILIVLFFDAVHEVRKYSVGFTGSKLQTNMHDHLHMKLFRSQRNLYISGFAVFLWLVIKRMVTLINQLAAASVSTAAFQAQADAAAKAAEKYREDNQLLKKTLMERRGDKATAEGMASFRGETVNLTRHVKTSEDDVLKKQVDGITSEYNSLLTEAQELQSRQDSGNKKED